MSDATPSHAPGTIGWLFEVLKVLGDKYQESTAAGDGIEGYQLYLEGEQLRQGLLSINGMTRIRLLCESVSDNGLEEKTLRKLRAKACLVAKLTEAEVNELTFDQFADILKGWNVTHSSGAKRDHSANTLANTRRKKVSLVPENSEVVKLMRELDRNRGNGVVQIQVARNFTSGDERKANSLLAQVRRFRRKHREA